MQYVCLSVSIQLSSPKAPEDDLQLLAADQLLQSLSRPIQNGLTAQAE